MNAENFFWPRFARMINKYLSSLEDRALNTIWVDDILNPEMATVSEKCRRIIASSYTSGGNGQSFSNYKVSIETELDSVQAFEQNCPFESWSDFEGRLNIVPSKRRIVVDAT